MYEKSRILASRQNPTVKEICALSDKKYRREKRLFKFDGLKLLREAAENGIALRYVVLSENAPEEANEVLRAAIENRLIDEENVIFVSDGLFERISEEKSPEGVISVAEYMTEKHRYIPGELCDRYAAASDLRLLAAESLRDPGNLGTVIRSCAALGIDRLIISDDCADLYNPKTIRGAMGGLFRLNIDVVPKDKLPEVVKALRNGGRKLYAAALHKNARSLRELELKKGDCFVIGNEGHGLSEKLIEACNGCAVIPMTEGSESLNAAAAAAICIWETVKAET